MATERDKLPHRILVALDGSVHGNRAAEYAADYAAQFSRCELILVHAEPDDLFTVTAAPNAEKLVEPFDLARRASATARARLDAAGISYRLHTELGDPADSIESVAQAERVDEIILGSRGLGQWKGLVMGSVAYRLIHRASMPVTVVRSPGADAQPSKPDCQRVLVPVDGSAPALHAVEYICQLHGAGLDLKVELSHVTAPLPDGLVADFVTKDMMDTYRSEQASAAQSAAVERLREAGVRFSTHAVSGRAAERIVELARALKCGRIVLGTRGLGSLAGLLLGSTSYQVIHLADVPVTLVR